MDRKSAKASGEYLGHGIADNGREYEGYMVNGEPRYFYTDDDTEMERKDKE